MSILDQIVDSVRAAEAEARARVPLETLLAQVRACAVPRRSLRAALASDGRPRIIAEVKRASPSKGDIRPGLDAAALARQYAAGRAAAVSVLTEPAFFKGTPADLRAVRAAVSLPVLRKDFILSEYAVAASAAMGADALLLIVRLLDAETLARLHAFAESLGLECLVEIHDEADLAKLGRFHPPLVGINNRNLATFDTDLGTAVRLARHLPPATIPVVLSGIARRADLAAAQAAGLSRFLIGESLVRSADPAALLRDLVGGEMPPPPQAKICGLTRVDQALACTESGADALGFVFHSASPRNVTPDEAREIIRALPPEVVPVGVFVEQSGAEIAAIACTAGLRTVQLHGPAMPDTAPLRAAGLRIVRVLFEFALPASPPDADAFLVECGRGRLPGGNGQPWDWTAAAGLVGALQRPCGLAGGLSAESVSAALVDSGAAAADASSGVESRPGIKDLEAVRRFVRAVHAVPSSPRGAVF